MCKANEEQCFIIFSISVFGLREMEEGREQRPANSNFFFFLPPPPFRLPGEAWKPQASGALGLQIQFCSRMHGETLELLNSLILQFQTSLSLTIFCSIITVLRFPNASLLHVTLARSQSSTVSMHGKCNSKEANKMDKPMIFVLASRMACYKTKRLL